MKKRIKMAAVVHCAGGCAVNDGVRACSYGCIACGACVSACRKDAIHIEGDSGRATGGAAGDTAEGSGTIPDSSTGSGVARVDRAKCVGCGLCARACPQGVIKMEPAEDTIQPLCSNKDAGAISRKACVNSCIACRICEKNCPAGAISVIENVAVIDPVHCIACGMCAVKCPRGVIRDAKGIMTAAF